ncbi:tRNA (adenosine(37)-N6)-dimethylallyltransferase MiaA [Uliginosibacterium paludis]|uniref:tRNA dimethylallyltransferase n=1 Tax=Uliginosibacterium paludis TaxID=1615952 RepID=A0ABV2CKD3_9RHOO
MTDSRLRAVMLMGPTASGKTAAALRLAEKMPIEIISVDSALVYRDMDIGTAKPTASEQASCPHHLIDILSPEQSYSAALFVQDTTRLVTSIAARGRIPVLAGGTMLYFKALMEGLSDLPQADEGLRLEIESRAAREGWPALHAELAALDPEASARLNPNDAQRIQRALEIVRLTGRPLAESYARREDTQPEFDCLPIALQPSARHVLHERIARRFDAMLEAGLVEEVRQLRTRYRLEVTMTSMRCVGYRQVWEYLDGLSDLATMREKGIAATRQLAKRQITWLRQFRENWSGYEEFDSLQAGFEDRVESSVRRWLTG